MATPVLVKPDSVGVITADAAYRLDEAKRRLGMSDHALRQARRAGLKVKYVGRRGYILGRDLLSFIESADSSRGTN